ncbi:hypothetical protein [Maricaulis sp.]|uniref:hypothetical protein n=1 Tax=Maricaulis sp. TaxID=1486257 RepID=UPI0026154ABD|nr:hypothetical protein [Maricaulis sp.]
MAITLEMLDTPGLVKLVITGQASRIDHVVHINRLDGMIRSGRMRALLVDASAAELLGKDSFSHEVWDALFTVIRDMPFAYLPPKGHETPERRAMIDTLVREWDGRYREFDSCDAALAWCRDMLSAGE